LFAGHTRKSLANTAVITAEAIKELLFFDVR
jgi:hypothetical protein